MSVFCYCPLKLCSVPPLAALVKFRSTRSGIPWQNPRSFDGIQNLAVRRAHFSSSESPPVFWSRNRLRIGRNTLCQGSLTEIKERLNGKHLSNCKSTGDVDNADDSGEANSSVDVKREAEQGITNDNGDDFNPLNMEVETSIAMAIGALLLAFLTKAQL